MDVKKEKGVKIGQYRRKTKGKNSLKQHNFHKYLSKIALRKESNATLPSNSLWEVLGQYGYGEAMESRCWMNARQLTRCHERSNKQAGQADDLSFWGNGWAEQLNTSTTTGGNCNPLKVYLQRIITRKHKSKKKVDDMNK